MEKKTNEKPVAWNSKAQASAYSWKEHSIHTRRITFRLFALRTVLYPSYKKGAFDSCGEVAISDRTDHNIVFPVFADGGKTKLPIHPHGVVVFLNRQ